MKLRAAAVVVCALAGGCFDPGGAGTESATSTETNGTTGPSSSSPSTSVGESGDPTTDGATTEPGETEASDATTGSTGTGSDPTTTGTPTCDEIECGDNQYCVDAVCLDPPDGMVAVPAGNFWMGCNEAIDPECAADEHPYHEVFLVAFAIDRYEVTAGQYQECVEAGGCSALPELDVIDQPCRTEPADLAAHCLTWSSAEEFCEWRGARLPTEAEWEKAARGDDGRVYPWGNDEPTCTLAVMSGCQDDEVVAVGTKPAGASPYGAADMAGNAFEWVADWYGSAYYLESPAENPLGPDTGTRKVFRSSGRAYSGGALRTSYRGNDFQVTTPGTVSYLMGVRCAMTP
jgi:formylglycine-generating enzyme required for sulfatase activity